MSANNWDTCPRCWARVQADHKALQRQVAKAYGKVPAEEYQRMLEESLKEPEETESLREDYEIGIGLDGGFYAIYRGYCEECGFEFKFRHSEQVKILPSGGEG